jgi:hypothetical protein
MTEEIGMSKFRAPLAMFRGSKKNGKAVSGWLSIEDAGDIVVWNLYRTTPLGTIGDLVDCRIDRKKVYFRTKAGDEMILSINTRDDAETFFRLISAESPPGDQHWAGLLTNEIFTKLVAELSDDDLDRWHQAIEVERYRRLLNQRKCIEPPPPSA